MLPEVGDLTTYEKNCVYSGFIKRAEGLVDAGRPLSAVLQSDLIELENRLETEVAGDKARFFKRHTHPITLQSIGKIAALRSQGALPPFEELTD